MHVEIDENSRVLIRVASKIENAFNLQIKICLCHI